VCVTRALALRSHRCRRSLGICACASMSCCCAGFPCTLKAEGLQFFLVESHAVDSESAEPADDVCEVDSAAHVVARLSPHRDLAATTAMVVRPTLTHEVCAICFDRPAGCILSPCGHSATCRKCLQTLKVCPLCRSPIESFQQGAYKHILKGKPIWV